MSGRRDRYVAAVFVAQLIAEGDPADDSFRLHQAIEDIRDELEAARRNQAEFPAHLERALEMIGNDRHSVRAGLRVVKGGAA